MQPAFTRDSITAAAGVIVMKQGKNLNHHFRCSLGEKRAY